MNQRTKKILLFLSIGLSAVIIIGVVVYFSFFKSTILFPEIQLSKLLKIDTTYRNSIRSFKNNFKKIKYDVSYNYITVFDNQIFPVVVFALSNNNKQIQMNDLLNDDIFIGDTSGVLGCNVKVSISSSEMENLINKTIPIRLELKGEKFINKSIIEAEINQDTKYNLFPKINYNYSLLENIIQPSLENVTFKIYCNNELIKEWFETIQFRGINEVPFLLMNDEGKEIDLSWLFVSFVNEDNPSIDIILKNALDVGIIDAQTGSKSSQNAFSGYQSGDREVINQVFSIWNVFQRYGIKYSNITTTSSTSKKVYSQYVRTFSDILNSNQANCVEGSILFASVLRKIGIDPFLVLLPGHMMVGFWTDSSYNNWVALETTIIGNEDINKYIDDKTFILGGLAWLLGASKNEISRQEFLYAINIGTETVNDNIDKFIDENNNEYRIINISDVRRAGIRNISK